jgi:hypothetical protein
MLDEATMNEKSCIGCKYLYSEGIGYSNYTWMATEVRCAKNRNNNLPAEEPYNRKKQPDNWSATKDSRCELYSVLLTGEMVAMDVDGEDGPADFTQDEEAIVAICVHSGRLRNGRC